MEWIVMADETRHYSLHIDIEIRPQDDLEHFQPGTVVGYAPQLGAEWVSSNDAAALRDFFAFFLQHNRLSTASINGAEAIAREAWQREQGKAKVTDDDLYDIDEDEEDHGYTCHCDACEEDHGYTCICETCVQNHPERDILYGNGDFYDWEFDEDDGEDGEA